MATRLKSRHIVKPAEPTWKGIFPLSELDQVSVVTHSSHLYFYNAPTNDKFKSNSLSEDKIIDTLKTSLSRALVPFYPLAGRVSWVGGGRLKLDCNAMGAELIEVQSNKEMSDFGEFYSSGAMFRDLLPEMDYYNKDIDKYPVLAVQVTRFQCGGLSLGISMSHVVIDGTSAFHFTKEWARLALGQPFEVAPFLDRRVLGATLDQVKGTNVVVNGSETNKNYLSELRLTQVKNWGKQLAPIFVRLTKDHIERLKKIANNNDNEKIIEKNDHNNKHERPYSRFEVLAAHVWRCMCLARELKNEDTTSFMAVVDARGRVDTSLLPLSYFGNAIVDAGISSNVGDLISRPLSYACGKVRESVEKVNTKYFFEVIEFYKNQPSLSKYQEIDDRGTVQGPSYGDNNVLVVSWLNLQGRGMDFGWGKEVHFGPPIVHACDGDIQISPYKDDGSVVVGVCLQPKEKFLEYMGFPEP